ITDKADIKLDGEKLVITSKSTGESSNIKVAIGGTDADDVKGVFGLDAEEAKGTDKVEAKEGGEGGTFTDKATVTNGTDSKNIESALDVSNHENATNAIETINEAITKVSTQRSKLGAFQNRLEHTINNLGTASENLTAAESRIRDVDMAKEMLAFSKKNILQQASQAMLAQAKQAPQGVLQLLR
ncbi:MAG: flagellin, partial [Tepidibacter sp.]|uniref:flagellin n=1 Tax=Tepidibacter sp. TaxID=2529387 RepID=UPI0025EC6BC5